MEFDFCGHRTPDQDLVCLRQLVEEIDARKIIEVGCFVGQSTLALAGKERVVWCIDTFEGPLELQGKKSPQDYYEVFLKNVGDLYPAQVKPIKAKSPQYAACFHPGFADLVFLDASHKFEDVCYDIQGWWRVLRVGGLMVIHDAFVINDVNKAVLYCFGKKAKVARRDVQCPRVDLPGRLKVPTNLFMVSK
jgi:cephalosporin hydroxylase